MASPDFTRDEPRRPDQAQRGKARQYPGVASVTHLPAFHVPDEHVALLLEVVLASPGLSSDTLRLGTHLERGTFEAALDVCLNRSLLRPSRRDDANLGRTRLFPTRRSVEVQTATRRPSREENAS